MQNKNPLKFSEFVQEYKNWKKSTDGESKIDSNEVKSIREKYEVYLSSFKKGTSKVSDKEAFEKEVARYTEWKKSIAKDKNAEVTVSLDEKKNIYRAMHGLKLVESKKKTDLDLYLDRYSEWKVAHKMSAKLTEAEKAGVTKLFESKKNAASSAIVAAKDERYEAELAKFTEWKKVNRADNPEVTELEKKAIKRDIAQGDIVAKINEAKKLCRDARVHMIEGDMMDAAAATQDAAAAVNAADAGAQAFNDPNALAGDPTATPLPQNIVDEIAAIKQSVDTLAAEAGIQAPLDLGADPNAGVAATTGVADPNAAAAPVADPNAAAPLPESIEAIKARLSDRESKLAEGKYFVDGTTAEADAIAKNKNLEKQNFNVDKTNPSEELVKIPSTNALLKGVATGPAAKEMAPADQWPTEKVSDVSMDKKLGNIEENTEAVPENKMEEAAQPEVSETTKKVQESLDDTGAFNWQKFVKSGKGF